MTFIVGDVDSRSDNVDVEYRDEMVDLSGWTTSSTGTVVAGLDGNAAGARYLRITLDPRDPTARYDMTGVAARAVRPPFRAGYGVTMSRRSSYTTCWFGYVGVAADGTPIADVTTSTAALTITGGVVISSSVATVTTTTAHGLMVGDRVCISGIADPRVNAYVIISGIPSATSFTYATTLGNATYGSSGTVTPIPVHLMYQEAMGFLARTATSGDLDAVVRAEGLTSWVQQWNPTGTWDAGTTPNSGVNYAASYVYPIQPKNTIEILHEKDWIGFQTCSIDSIAAPVATQTRDQLIPMPAGGLVPKVQIRNLPNIAVPAGRITVAAKSGSSTATLTIPNHGLTTSDYVYVYGVRDQTNFANATTPTAVGSVVDANNITIGFGASATATSYGGTVFRAQANTTHVVATSSLQSVGVSGTGRFLVTFAANYGTFNVGESVCVAGLVDSTNTAQPTYEGLYRVASANSATFQLELEPLQGQPLPGGTITCGGTVFAVLDFRIHFLRAQSHGRTVVEIESGRGHARQASAIPVTWGGNTAPFNLASVAGSTVTTATDIGGTNRALGVLAISPPLSTEKASATVTTTGNTGGIASTFGQSIAALINCTASSGSGQTMDVTLQESYDNGTTWHDIWHSPRITGTGTVPTPPMIMAGRRKWVYTIAGSSPSFTFSILSQVGQTSGGLVRQFFDRAIDPTSTNSASGAFWVEGCSNFSLLVKSGAGAASPVVYGIQFSPDASSWADAGMSLNVAASSTVAAALATPFPARWARVYVKTGQASATQTYACLNATSS